MRDLNYWARQRIGRRAALRGAGLGLAGIAGAALVGCGDEEETPATPTQAPSGGGGGTPAPGGGTPMATATPDDMSAIPTPRIDTTDQAVPGGIYKSFRGNDVPSLDPLTTTTFTTATVSRWVYPQLVQFIPGIVEPATGDVQPYLAESVEYGEDGTTVIMKIRPDAKWDERAPTNSRAVDAEDVVWSWGVFAENSIGRQALANAANPEVAPITSMEAVDANTLQINTAFPYGPLVQSLAYSRWFQIMPREAESDFDPRNEMRGAGPWYLSRYDRSVRFEFRKNPNFWRSDRPFLEGFDLPIIAEYSQRLAQFRAKQIWGGVPNQEDIIGAKEEFPELNIYQGEFGRVPWQIYFGLRPDSPFVDERVRAAVSMAIDRALILDTFSNVATFQEAGWPTEARWHNVGIAAGNEGFWIDPQSGMGDDGQFFAYNPDEAAKLLDAAGHGGGLNTSLSYIATPQYGTTFPNVGEAFIGLLEATGLFTVEQRNPDYQTEYLPSIYFGKGDFDGIAWGACTTYPHVSQHLLEYYHSKGGRQKVAFKGDAASVTGQAESDALIERIMRSTDFDEQVDLIQQWQRENAKFMPIVPSPWPGGVPGYGAYWPWVMNLGAYRDYLESAEQAAYIHWWIDQSQLPADA